MENEHYDHKAMVTSTTPLLVYVSNLKEGNDSDHDVYDLCHQEELPNYNQWRPSLYEVIQEIKQLYNIAIPMIITGLLIYGKSVISMLFMGSLGKEALAGGSLSTGIANITGYSIISGLATGMEPISSQACGAQRWSVMGQTLQQTISLLLLICIPITILWLNIEPILLFSGQDPTISAIAATYLVFSLPDLFFQSFINPIKIYLRTQNVTMPLMLGAGFSLFLHAPINYLLVCHCGLGIKGIAISGAITNFFMLIFLLLYSCMSVVCQKSWHWDGWSSTCCLEDWRTLLRLSVPSCVSVCLEWWWYELMIVLSGLLPNAAEAVASMGILLQATSFIYIFPSALSMAVSTRVGNELGANEPSRAMTSFLTAFSCAIFNGLIAMFFMVIMRNKWGRAFTNDEAIQSLTATVMMVAAMCELGNCPQTAGCGVLRGSARPTVAANINLGSFYGVGLPVAVLMGLVMDMGLPGLWLGLLSAQIVCALVMILVLMKTDWAQQANRGRELIGVDDVDYETQKITIL